MQSQLKMVLIIIVVTLLSVAGLVWMLSSQFAESNTPTVSAEPVDAALLLKPESHILANGVTGAPQVMLVEFSDLQCPACRAAAPAVKQLLAKYQGKVAFSYRHFPLSIHRHAEVAARAAEAAATQGKFFEMHDVLFGRQDKWSTSKNPTEQFIEYAVELGLNKDQFTSDLNSASVKAAVAADNADAFALKISSTPTFFVNGKLVSGFSQAEIETLIEAALAQAPTGGEQVQIGTPSGTQAK